MSTISKERAELKAFITGFLTDPMHDDKSSSSLTAEVFRIALASLEAEAVAYMYKDNLHADARFSLHTRFGNWSQEDINEYEITEIPLYTAPPAPVSVPDAMEMDDDFDSAFEHGKAVGWNAYRAAMLQSFGNSEQLNSPVIQDGWVACSERMPEEGSKVIVFRPRASESNDPPVKTATYKGGREYYHGFDCYCEPTHWMPLPAAPQQEA
ncbi:TPA: DUF551 domain-containing protein [Citrobacter freundii]